MASRSKKWVVISKRALGIAVFGIIPIVYAFNVLQVNLPKIHAIRESYEQQMVDCLSATNNEVACGVIQSR